MASHSGIATLTLLLEGAFSYEDSLAPTGGMSQGAVEWMQAGGGVWHKGGGLGGRMKGYQLWVALPPKLEASPPLSRYLGQESFPRVGPARVILGELGQVRSPIVSLSSMNYLDVHLEAFKVKAGAFTEHWHVEELASMLRRWAQSREGARRELIVIPLEGGCEPSDTHFRSPLRVAPHT